METIAQLLKEKNRIIASIKKIETKLKEYNQIIKGNTRPYDINKLYTQLVKEQQLLVDVKTKIHFQSEPIRNLIFLQSELKNRITILKQIPHQHGIIQPSRYSSESSYEVESIIQAEDIDILIENLEKEINTIQDTLDTFNHSVK